MGRAWDVGLHSPRGPGVPPGTGRPARSDLLLWYGGINNNNGSPFYEARLGGGEP